MKPNGDGNMAKSEQTQSASGEGIQVCDGQGLKRMVRAGLAWLEINHETVNALNVFPVPDGDTGTNMLLTMRSAHREIADSDDTHAGRVAHKIYNGALMGARGNSGVILSQLWWGFARALEDNAQLDSDGFMRGFQEAARTAYKAVQEPVEGTMLTVARETAEEVGMAAEHTTDLHYLLERAVERAHESVERTPELLDVLRDAGVVDAGGMGLAYILEGMLRDLNGESLEVTIMEQAAVDLHSALAPMDELGYGYDVQYLLKGQGLDVNQVRVDIAAMGDCPLVVGDAGFIKVHIHVHDPGIPLSYGASLGELQDVVVENMQEQYQEFVVHGEGPHRAGAPATIEPPEIIEGTIAVVTVAPGEGLARIFYSLGTGQVISGGQTMNPSTEQIVEAINNLPTDKVIVLPNNKNIVMAAEQAARLTNGKYVSVVPTRTVPQGIAALLALDPEGDLEQMVEAMQEASQTVETGEITTATRNATIDGVKVKKGQVIGLHNDSMCVAGDDVNTVVLDLLRQMGTDDLELITLYYGADVDPREAEVLAEHLTGVYPDHEVELREGGQAHYFYILSVE